MKITTYSPKTPDLISAEYDDQLQCIFVAWKKLTSNDMQPCCEAQIEALKKFGGKFIIIDLSLAEGAIKKEDQEWFGNIYYPRLANETKIKKIITILSKSALTGLSMRRYKQLLGINGIDMYECVNMYSALLMLKS